MTRTFFLTEDQIMEEYSNADKETLSRFWDLIGRFGSPLRELDGVRTTFVWRDLGGNVPMHLYMNRITDKQNYDLGLMKQVPGTDIHVRTLELSPTHTASYGFQPAAGEGERRDGPPPLDHYPTYLDLHNPRALVRDGIHGLSLFEGPLVPFRREWDFDSADITGSLFSEEVEVGGALRRLWLYLPAESGDGPLPLPLMTLFDAETWFGRLHLPVALEKAAAEGKIPPMAVLGIANVDQADRVASLSANEEFLAEVFGPATIWAVAHAASRGVTFAGPEGQIIAGQSLGGLSALVSVLREPERYRYAIAASPSLWWEPGEKRTPADLGSRTVDWITEQFGKGPQGGTRVLLSAGVREELNVPGVHLLEQTMRYRGWDADINVYDGGHDFAWWRVALIDDLGRIFAG